MEMPRDGLPQESLVDVLKDSVRRGGLRFVEEVIQIIQIHR